MQILDKIKSPADIMCLTDNELCMLAGEIRETIIKTAAQNGGHLASNLGMVDATVALHRVFSCPRDAFVFDVGHQAYAHKLLTGRLGEFPTIRQFGGLSGFTNREESGYDAVTAGHGGSSLSAAVGMAHANRLAGRGDWVVDVIGDGSFTNGMIYEALEQIKGEDLRLLILLNDNEMSISKNVGGISAYLSLIRTSERYFSFKLFTKKVFSSIPLVGGAFVRAFRAVKNFIKRLLGAETLFESLGLEYIGPVDGNNIKKMISILEEAKSKNCPVIVHMKTRKGLGFAPSEEHPELYHSTSGFPLGGTTGNCAAVTAVKKRTFTDEVSDYLTARAADYKNLVAITAAMTDGCGLARFAKAFPDRFFDVGIAEEHAVAMAGGLSIGGICPVVVMYSTFSQRVFDELWHDVALQDGARRAAHIVLLLSHAGIVPGDGVTHQGIYDVSLISAIPGAEIYSPDTFEWLQPSLDAAMNSHGVSVVRYPKGGEVVYSGVAFDERETWKSCTVGQGAGNGVVVTYGRIAKNVLRAVNTDGIRERYSVTVVVLERIFPLPDDAELYSLVNEFHKIIFVEEGIRRGGIGEMFASSERVRGEVRIRAVDVPEIPNGDLPSLMKFAALDEDSLAADINGFFSS